MFSTLSRSWEFTKISYSILWQHKSLVAFPIVSGAASLLVLASFIVPLWMSGFLESAAEGASSEDGQTLSQSQEILGWVLTFAFYFCSYFVIVFFNTGLIACAMRVLEGEEPSIGYGMHVAMQRLPQIAGWALLSAAIGTILRMIENANEKAGAFIAAILGSAWTALTYFVVPVIVIEGKGPIGAFKSSVGVLKDNWGTALVGNFSLGFVGFLVMLPVILIGGVATFAAFSSGSTGLGIGVGTIVVMLVLLAAAFTSAADVVFKAVLYNFATGRATPEAIEPATMREAFRSKD